MMLKLLATLLCLFCLTTFVRAEEYYCLVFSHDTHKPRPAYSHTWATFVKMSDKQKVEKEFTISWYPQGKWRLCSGKVPGYNKSLKASVEDAIYDKENPRKVCMWGPYEISKESFTKAENRYNSLNKTYMYIALDSQRTRSDKNQPATNCIHAVSDIFPGLATGTKYGESATQMVVDHLADKTFIEKTERVSLKGERVVIELGLDKYKTITRK
jgi:hypothetical protein